MPLHSAKTLLTVTRCSFIALLALGLGLPAGAAEPRGKVARAAAGKLVKSDGRQVRPFQLDASPTHYVLYHSAGWCRPCRAVTQKLDELYRSLDGRQDRKIEVIMINHDASQEAMDAYLLKSKATFPALLQAETDKNFLARIQAVEGLPTLLIVDPEGKVVASGMGAQCEALIDRAKRLAE